ncbi:hypothetical protein TB1_034245 [Malus domestica]
MILCRRSEVESMGLPLVCLLWLYKRIAAFSYFSNQLSSSSSQSRGAITFNQTDGREEEKGEEHTAD